VRAAHQDVVSRHFPNEDPLGRRIALGTGSQGPWLTIVGVVGDVREDGMDQPPQPIIYRAEDQNYFAGRIIFRTRGGDPMALVPAVRRAVRTADPAAGIYRIVRLQDEARGSAWKLNYSTLLLTGLAALAVLLAVLGVYGLLSYTVRERTQEIGVRMAIGADRSQVLAQVIREGVLLVGAGIAIGLAAAGALTRFLSSLLFGVASLDPLSFTVVALLLLAAGCLARSLPARRAANLDPLVALRYE
jgi:putative ABC transport system permease protein